TLVFSAPVTTALTPGTITVTFPSPVPFDKAATFIAANGLVQPPSVAKDKFHTATGNNELPNSGSTAATTQADELLIGALGYNMRTQSLVAGTGFTNLTVSVTGGGSNANGVLMQAEYEVVHATGAYAASGSGNANKAAPWAAAIVSYKIVTPKIVSIASLDFSSTPTPSTANFTVTFSEPVIGVDGSSTLADSDFVLVASGVSGASITSATPDITNTIYTVAVDTGTGNGTLQLNYHDDADLAVDMNNIPLYGSGTGPVTCAVAPAFSPDACGPVYNVSKSVATTTGVSSSSNSPKYGDSVTFTATVTPASGSTPPTGTVQFAVDGTSLGSAVTLAASGSNGTATSIGDSTLSVGSHNITATYTPTGTFTGSNNSATPFSLSVAQATQTITFNALGNKTYGDADFNVSATATSGLPVTFTASGNCTVVGTLVHITGAGSCTITAHQAGDSNYNTATDVPQLFTVSQKSVTPSITANDKTYDATNTATLATPAGCTVATKVDSDDVACISSSVTFASANASLTPQTVTASSITLTGTMAANYTLSTNTATTTAKINARPLTVTAAENTKTYDGTTSAAATPTITSGTLEGSDTANFTETYDNKNVGTGKTLTPSGTVSDGNSGSNYAYTFATAAGTINQAPLTITAATNTKTYDSTTSAAGTPTVTGLVGGDTATGLVEAYADKNVGTGKTLSVSAYTVNDGNNGNNYTVTTPTNATGVINAAPLTLTAVTNTKTYDTTASAAATPTVGGIQGADTATGLAETYSDPNAGTGKTLSVSAYTVNDGNGGNNYSVSKQDNSTGVINQADARA
ncbi:MAG: hypothetical protein DMG21_08505, partial [Acidobacteria bacterium]